LGDRTFKLYFGNNEAAQFGNTEIVTRHFYWILIGPSFAVGTSGIEHTNVFTKIDNIKVKRDVYKKHLMKICTVTEIKLKI
jgi:hypothetical protein